MERDGIVTSQITKRYWFIVSLSNERAHPNPSKEILLLQSDDLESLQREVDALAYLYQVEYRAYDILAHSEMRHQFSDMAARNQKLWEITEYLRAEIAELRMHLAKLQSDVKEMSEVSQR